MPAKHSASPFSPARTVFVLAVATLVALVIWVAFRAVGPSGTEPTLVLPSSSPSTSVSPAPAPSPSPSHSPSRSPSARPKVSKTSHVPSKSARATTKPAASVSATLAVNGGRGGGYIAVGRVLNTGKTAVTWKITVAGGQAGARLGGTWNAQGSQQGTSFVFTGGPLAPGATATFGYQAGGGKPSGCSVVGGTCRVS